MPASYPAHTQRLELSRSFRLSRLLKRYLDDYYLDGVIGLIPVAGDVFSQTFNLVFVYIAAFKIRSLPLTIMVVFNGLLDLLIGLIPFLGTVLDFFHKSYKRNFELLEAYGRNDRTVIHRVRHQALLAALGIVALTAAIIWLLGHVMILLEQGWLAIGNWF